MPELPDIVVYIEALEQRILNATLERVQIASPFLLRTAVPPITSVEGRKVVELRRLGKRICVGLEGDLWLVLHLMIAGRLHWHQALVTASRKAAPPKPSRKKLSTPPRNRLAAFEFSNGTVSWTEAGSKRRASLHVVTGEAGLQRLDPGGLEVFGTAAIDVAGFAKVLTSANHTLKRALADPRLFSGIGNAYSDEILFDARLSPIALTQKLTSEQIERLFESTRATLTRWVELLRAEAYRTESGPGSPAGQPGWDGGSKQASTNVQSPTSKVQDGMSQGEEGQPAPAGFKAIGSFPEKVTAFRPEMAVHGKYQQPCPRCGSKIQRIRYASNETNYCPNCQTAGKLLADRSLSRLLRADWPRTPEELEGLTRNK